jgi:lipopolysaccharide biosynthesis glycosyltransferase
MGCISNMIITNSTPDEYYYDQLITFLISIKINSPKHLKLLRIFLANYPSNLVNKLRNSFPETIFENNHLDMTDSRGFSLIIDRAMRIKECLKKYEESVTWMDTDIIVRGDISELLEVKPKQLKILYRKDSPERVKINAGVFSIGYSRITYKFIDHWYNRIKVGKKWGDGQLEFWRGFQRYRSKIEMVELPLKFNSIGKFNQEYFVWHCKKGHFDREKYQVEYKKYLDMAKQHIRVSNSKNAEIMK